MLELNNIEPELLENLFAEDVKRIVLKNGLTVVFKEDRSAELASAQLWVKTGSIHEGQYLGSGISHYVEHMLFKGTEKRSYKEISSEIHAAGGQVNAYTTFDRTVYYIDILSEAAELAVDILADIAFHSKMDKAEATSEKDVILREIDMGKDDPDRILSEALLKRAFQKHPYRHPIIGHRHIFKALEHTDLKNYYKSRYVPNNIVLVVVGAVDFQDVQSWAEKYMGHEATEPIPPYYEFESNQLAEREERLYGDYNLVRGGLAFKIPGLSHPDAPALDVLANVLGQGRSSILWQQLRENKKLVHEISCSAWNPGSTGLFWISYTCDPGKCKQVEEAIIKELNYISEEGVEDALVKKCIRQAVVGEVNSRKTMSGQASRLGVAEVVIGDLKYPQIYIERLAKVVPGDLGCLITQYLHASALTTVSLEPESEKKDQHTHQQRGHVLPDFEEHQLKNGMRVLLQPWPHFPKVNLRFSLLGGACYEDSAQRGVTSLMATLLARDTKHRSTLEIAQAIEGVGGSFGEYAGNNSFGLGLEVLKADLPLGLELVSQALKEPLFLEETFEIERSAQIAQIEESMDEIVDFGIHHLRKRFFGEHPHSSSPLGAIETLKTLTPSELKHQWKELVCANNIVIAASGDFKPKELIAQLDEALGDLPKGSFAQKKFPLNKPAETGKFEAHLKREQAVLFQAYPGIGATDPAFEVAELLDEMLSGLSSQLFTHVREEKGMAYYVGSSQMIGLESGMFYFYAGTSPDQVDAVYAEIDKEIKRIQKGKISDDEFERCKTRLKAAKRMSLQTISSRAMQTALDALYGMPANHWRTYDRRIDTITKESLQEFAQKNFTPEKEVKLVVKAE